MARSIGDIVATFVRAVRIALPDIKATIQAMVTEGDYVAMWNTATATHRGELFWNPSVGKANQHEGLSFLLRFREGKIVEHWNQVAST